MTHPGSGSLALVEIVHGEDQEGATRGSVDDHSVSARPGDVNSGDHAEQARLKPLDNQVADVCLATEVLARLTLLLAGYRQHDRAAGIGGVASNALARTDAHLAVIEQLNGLLIRSQDGDQRAIAEARAMLDEHPDLRNADLRERILASF